MFTCEQCRYKTNREYNYIRHCRGKRHCENTSISHVCACGKIYTHKSSLSRHQKTCSIQANINSKTKEDTSEVTEKFIKSLMSERREPSTMNIFNVQIYLDKECSGAKSIQDFTDTMSIELAALERMNKEKALLRIIQKNLTPMPIEERPFHCTDLESKQFMVKDRLKGWEKDNGMKVIQSAENSINKRWPTEFNCTHPGWDHDPGLHDRYLSIAMNSYSTIEENKCNSILSQLARSSYLTTNANLLLC